MTKFSKLKMSRVCKYIYLYLCINCAFIAIDFIDCTRVCDFSDPCDNSMLLSSERRDVTCPYMQDNLCDDVISSTWYKIEGSAVMSCPEKSSCGALYPIWLNGTLPEITGDIVIRTMCVRGFIGCCDLSYQIKIKLCPGFHAFCLPSVSSCPSRYCFNGNHCLSSTASVATTDTTTVLPNETVKVERTEQKVESTTVMDRGGQLLNDTGKGDHTEEKVESTTVINRDSHLRNDGTNENDTWKFVAFGCIGLAVLTITTVFLVCFIRKRQKEKPTRSLKNSSYTTSAGFENDKGQYDEIKNIPKLPAQRRKNKQTKFLKNGSLTDIARLENEAQYDVIENLPNSPTQRTIKSQVRAGVNGSTTKSSNSPNDKGGEVDGPETSQREGNEHLIRNKIHECSNEFVLNQKNEQNIGQSTSINNEDLRNSMQYDDFDLKCEHKDMNDPVSSSDNHIISPKMQDSYDRSPNPYQTLQDYHQYEGMTGNHTYQPLRTEHRTAIKSQVHAVVCGDTTKGNSPNPKGSKVDGPETTQRHGNEHVTRNKRHECSNEFVLNQKKENNTGQSTSINDEDLRNSMQYDDFDYKCDHIGIKVSVNSSENHIISLEMQDSYDRSPNPYQTLQDYHQYEGMSGDHVYQPLRTEHQYEFLTKSENLMK